MKYMKDAPEDVLKALALYYTMKYPELKAEQVYNRITKLMNEMGYYHK